MKLFKEIDGDVFFALKVWPLKVKKLFWKKPQTDNSTFQVYLFLVGNGCPPEISQKWILSSLYWSKNKDVNKRMHQLKWLQEKFEEGNNYNDKWFYFDLQKNLHLYLNGSKV